jgi:hypothetical protein
MSEYKTSSPVLFLIFNRPDVTFDVFEKIRSAKPSRLYVAADGPRVEKNEEELCKETRNIINQIDWDCQVKTLFRENNLGCKYAVSSAIDWFFSNEEQGIILEDDCLPSNDFFIFCDMMLDKYRLDSRIRHIGGSNFQNGISRGKDSYYFSKLTHVWGWASWRRSWIDYDVELLKYNSLEINYYFNNVFKNIFLTDAWVNIFNKLIRNEIDTWDYQWSIANFFNNGLSIIPNVNLISNIGFSENATHTKDKNHVFSKIEFGKLESITHPVVIVPDMDADFSTLYTEYIRREMRKKNKTTIFYNKLKFWKKSKN